MDLKASKFDERIEKRIKQPFLSLYVDGLSLQPKKLPKPCIMSFWHMGWTANNPGHLKHNIGNSYYRDRRPSPTVTSMTNRWFTSSSTHMQTSPPELSMAMIWPIDLRPDLRDHLCRKQLWKWIPGSLTHSWVKHVLRSSREISGCHLLTTYQTLFSYKGCSCSPSSDEIFHHVERA